MCLIGRAAEEATHAAAKPVADDPRLTEIHHREEVLMGRVAEASSREQHLTSELTEAKTREAQLKADVQARHETVAERDRAIAAGRAREQELDTQLHAKLKEVWHWDYWWHTHACSLGLFLAG
jgi:septal ring factor EnvC (AmiA/AmiB activator)